MKTDFLKALASKNNLAYMEKEQIILGDYRGYFVTVSVIPNAKKVILSTNIDFSAQENDGAGAKQSVNAAMHSFTQENTFVDYYTAENYVIKAAVNVKSDATNEENLQTVLNHMVTMLVQNGFAPCCSVCGEKNFLAAYSVNGEPHCLCSNCYSAAKDRVASAEMANAKSGSNVFMGIIGALLGALIGGVLWVLIYQLGYIAGIAGLVTIACAYKGYTMFSKRKDVKAVIISIVISVLVLFGAHTVCWAIDLYALYSTDYIVTIFDMIKLVPEYYIDPEFTMMFFKDLLVGYVLMVVASVSFIKSAIKNPMKTASIEKIDYKSMTNV